MVIRIFATLVVLLMQWFTNFIISTPATLVTGQVAGSQFDNSDASYVMTRAVLGGFSLAQIITCVLFTLLLTAIWYHPVKRWIMSLAVLGLIVIAAPHADAYYDKQDFTEAYFILPNESAFFIPDVGANKDSQAAFGSEDYLKANKIPAKRFQIPHAKLQGSGTLFADYYVPSGRLIIVDRTPYSREWVASNHRGSSSKDESFPCQSKEGLNITVGVTIGASVLEENSAKFLYRFGVLPPQGNRQDPQVIFTSVFYGRSLATVMDGPVRNKIQSLVCNEFMDKSLDDGNAQAKKIVMSVETKAAEYLASVGITLDYIGYADTLSFDHDVQDAINRAYIATQEAKIAASMAPHVATLQGLASAEATRTISKKWDGKVPNSVSLWWLSPAAIGEFFSRVINPSK